MGLILDSSIFIAAERGKFDLPRFFIAHAQEAFFIAAVTASELLHGVERANTPERRLKRRRFVEDVLLAVPAIEFDLTIAREHARLWALLESSGQMIGPHDTQIAATALAGSHSLGMLNHDEFARVARLSLANVAPFIINGQ